MTKKKLTAAAGGDGEVLARDLATRVTTAEAEVALLRARVRAIEKFVRHDARTPLTVILGHAQMLGEGLLPEARKGESYAAITRQATALGARIEGLITGGPDGAPARTVWVACPARAVAQARAQLDGVRVIVAEEGVVARLAAEGEVVVPWTADAEDLCARVNSITRGTG